MTKSTSCLVALLVIFLLGFTGIQAQSISVYPTVAYRGQVNTFIVTGTNASFNQVSSCYLYNQGPTAYFDIYPTTSGSSLITGINLPTSTPLGLYDFGITYFIGGGVFLQDVVNILDPPSSAGTISGRVRRSSGCTSGTSLPNRLILINPGGFLTTSGPSGEYSVFVPAGASYSVQVLPTAVDTMVCPSVPYTANVSTVGQNVANLDFGMNTLNVTDIEVEISPAVHRPGFTISNWVTVKNNGAAAATGVEVKVSLPSWVGYTSNTGGGTFLNDTITWTIPYLSGLGTVNFQFVVVPPINSLGWPYTYTASATTITPDIAPDNNYTSVTGFVQGSYDPNDKQVWTQDGVNADGPVNPTDSLLRYLIRFQNTGTDTAFNIRINDLIDPNLDISTLQITQSSHPYQIELLNNNEINFHFPNILLLDSNANEPLSHGFIGYSMKRNPNLPLGTEIENEANIYFDFNLPVLTNKVVSKICPPVNLDFSTSNNLTTLSIVNNSTGGPGSILWDFGDGNTSNASAPTHTYASGGNYSVCLNFTDTCGTRTFCKLVAITCTAPTTAYQANTNQLSVNFSDQSSSSVFGWQWDFGDGNTSNAQNPNHLYSAAGSYQVCLTSTDSCNSVTWCDTVVVTCTAPTAAYQSSANQLSVSFSDQSSSSVSGWQWDFGDGNTSNAQNPNHTYSAPGTYQVCLTAIDTCTSTTWCDSVVVTCPAPVPGFTGTSNNLQASFSNQSTGQGTLSYLWDFGDGSTSSFQNPNHIYSLPGTYLVCLTATDVCGSVTFCDSILLTCPAPAAGFASGSTNLLASFSNQSTGQGTLSYSWDFGDGSNPSTAPSPTHLYPSVGSYLVCLTTTDLCGSTTWCDSVQITCISPIADFGFNATGSLVQFMDLTADSIVSWAWDFGDGNTSSAAAPQHSYAGSGSYSVCLVVTNTCGAMDTTCETLTVVGVEEGPFRSLQLYPNPSDGIFNLSAEFAESGQLNAEVRDLAGRVLYQGNWGEVQGLFRKRMEMNLPAGSYFIQLELNGRRVNRMFSIH